MKFDLEERTSAFAEECVSYCKGYWNSVMVKSMLSQLLRSSTSVAANYMEATGAESKKDFRHKVSICRKEAKEARYWLRIVGHTVGKTDVCVELQKEAHELTLIFSSIVRSCDGRRK